MVNHRKPLSRMDWSCIWSMALQSDSKLEAASAKNQPMLSGDSPWCGSSIPVLKHMLSSSVFLMFLEVWRLNKTIKITNYPLVNNLWEIMHTSSGLLGFFALQLWIEKAQQTARSGSKPAPTITNIDCKPLAQCITQVMQYIRENPQKLPYPAGRLSSIPLKLSQSTHLEA